MFTAYLIVVFVRFTAEEDGRLPSESDVVKRFPIMLVATVEEAVELSKNEEKLLQLAQYQNGFPFGKLGHVSITKFCDGHPVATWQPNYWLTNNL